ncbi:MAG TPA: lysylphosphatidylglycerol synthase domain-containing protein [Polyangiaceae bacterium]|nr:lysylphosphatidylglycerol synthase domain-containing protein [Polyangiaceae bacterium]
MPAVLPSCEATEPNASDPKVRARTVRRRLFGAASACAGGALLWIVVASAGGASTLAVVLGALPLVPLAVAIEGTRIGTEILAMQRLFAMLKCSVPLGAIVRAQFIGYSVGNVVPVGRLAAEATKAGLLAKHARLATTAAVAAIAQALHLLASAVILVPSAVAARSMSAPLALSATIAGQCLLLGGAGGGILLAAYFVPSRWLHRLPKASRALESFRAAIRSLPAFPARALGWLVLCRFLQVVLIAVLMRAVRSQPSVAAPFLAQGVLLVGASVGDVVPGQVGALEGIFRLFASTMGMTPTCAVSVALLIHAVQALWVFAGFVAFAFGKNERPLPSSTSLTLPALRHSAGR